MSREHPTGELPPFVADRLPERTAEAEETVAALVALGVEETEARAAVADGRVPLVLAQRLFADRPRYTLAQLSRRSGVPEELLLEARRALGLPPAERYSRADLAWARQLRRALDLLSPEAVIRSGRARGRAAWTMAMGDLATVREEVVLPLREQGADDLTIAVALADVARTLEPVGEQLSTAAYRLVVSHVLSSELAAVATRTSAPEVELTVGFVDVVGYTALSARIDPSGLDEVLDAFEERVSAVVSGAEGVAVVKHLGDAVMLIGADAPTLADTILELLVPVPAMEDAPLRAGMAAGPTLVREGDYYGPAVNLAARLTDRARPWTLLADEELAPVLGERFELRRIPPVRLRGIGIRRPVAVRRPAG